jgi:hypothetical protein
MLDELWPHGKAIGKIQARAADLVVRQLSIFVFVDFSTLP